jgi:hypothetical protein
VVQKDPDALAQYGEYDKIVHPYFSYLPKKALDDLLRTCDWKAKDEGRGTG